MFIRHIVYTLFIGLILGAEIAPSAQKELTQTQAITRVRTILQNNAGACRLKTRSISAVKVRAGWRVTARVTMSAGGITRPEIVVWIISQRNGAVAQNQLTAEVQNGC